jgi:hypothetical protein
MINFFITGPGRSGSQMLSTALAQHSEIHSLGEVFLPAAFHHDHIPQGRLTITTILDHFGCLTDKKILGFVVHYNELFRSRYTTGLAGELLKREFRVIHLTRDNLLRRFLSKQVALNTEVWADTTGKSPSTLKLTLSSKDLFLDIKATLANAKRIKLVFSALPLLEVSYEDLCADFSREFDRVCEFLNASHENIAPKTFKQETRPMREAIANYDRLKLLFSPTKYRRFFVE